MAYLMQLNATTSRLNARLQLNPTKTRVHMIHILNWHHPGSALVYNSFTLTVC